METTETIFGDEIQLVVFRLGREDYGISILQVRKSNA